MATEDEVNRVAKAMCGKSDPEEYISPGFQLWHQYLYQAKTALRAMGYEIEGEE